MYGEIAFTTQEWVQDGVHCLIKEVPGATGANLLAPEAKECLQDKPEPDHYDPAEAPIDQWEFTVDNDGWAVPVSGYCLSAAAGEVTPAAIYIHGGGWRMGDRKSADAPMRLLAQYSGCRIFSIEYRLAPEYMYPTATDDCWKVVRYICNHADELKIDPKKITVFGDSAGGNMACVCAHRDRNQRRNLIAQQILIYPVLTFVEPEDQDYHFSLLDYRYDDSEKELIEGAILALSGMKPDLYLRSGDDPASPDVSPLLEKNFAGLPKTRVISAEYDFLTQQGRLYAHKLSRAGVPVSFTLYRGTVHGFLDRLGRMPQTTELIREIAEAIRSI